MPSGRYIERNGSKNLSDSEEELVDSLHGIQAGESTNPATIDYRSMAPPLPRCEQLFSKILDVPSDYEDPSTPENHFGIETLDSSSSMFSPFNQKNKPAEDFGIWKDLLKTSRATSPHITTRWTMLSVTPPNRKHGPRATNSPLSTQTENPKSPKLLRQPPTSPQTHSWSTLPFLHESSRFSSIPPRKLRGLINVGNSCFMNVILQSLMACEPFREYLLETQPKKTTLIYKFCILAWEMVDLSLTFSENDKHAPGSPIRPDWLYNIFCSCGSVNSTNVGKNRGSQEDAEEFLCFTLNKLHEETLSERQDRAASCVDGWEQVRFGGQRFMQTPISKIFRGSFISEVNRPFLNTNITEELFFSISLDIGLGTVGNICDALQNYFRAETIDDGDWSHRRRGFSTEKQVFLHRIPQVLILHLKRFSRNAETGALVKMIKQVAFPELLHLPSSIMYLEREHQEGKNFELAAVVTHTGLRLAGGHYTCDVRFRHRNGCSIWFSCDDHKLLGITLDEVLRKQAYLLFYTAL